MKRLPFEKRLIRLAERLLFFCLITFSQAVFAQQDGYWDVRFGAGIFRADDYVRSIGVADNGDMFIIGKLYVGGQGNGIMKWNGNGWSPFVNVKGHFKTFVTIGNDLYLGGGFTEIGGIQANNIVKYNLATKTWSPLGSGEKNGTDHIVRAIAVQGKNLYVGGAFRKAGVKSVNYIAKYNTVTNTWTPLGIGLSEFASVDAIVVKDGDVYVGGYFNAAGGVPAKNIAKWNGYEWSPLNSGRNWQVQALLILGDDLYVGSESGIAKWNTVDKAWSSLGAGVDGGVTALASDGNVVYVSGEFIYSGEMLAGPISKWNPATSCWSRVGDDRHVEGGSVNGSVYSILTRGNDVYLGGNFRSAGRKPSQLFAIWHEPVSPKPHAPVWASVPDVAFREDSATQIDLYQYVTDTEHDLRGGLAFSAKVIASPVGTDSTDLKIQLRKLIMGIASRYAFATFSAAKNTSGFYTVVFTVTDVCGNAASDTLRVTVTPANGAPIIAPLPELTFNEDDSLLFPIRNWYDDVTDVVNPDSALFFRIFSSREVKAVRREKNFLFTAAPNWFGVSRLKLVVRDRRGLADTTTLVVKVNAVNDSPVWRGLPDSLRLKPGVATTLNLWEFADDLETPDSLLHFNFVPNKSGFGVDFNKKTGTLSLSASNFSSRGRLYITVRDWKRAAARDSIFIRVESSNVAKTAAGGEQLPVEFMLQQNYPNPFNPTTLIRFGLPQEAAVKLEVLNLNGQLVATLLNARQAAGYHEVLFEAGHLPSGNYFTVLRAGEMKLVRRIVLMK